VFQLNQETSSQLVSQLFKKPSSKCAWMAFLSRGKTLDDLAVYEGALSNQEAGVWIKSQVVSSLSITNRLAFPAKISWVPEGKPEVLVASIPPNQANSMQSFLGHIFTVRNQEGKLIHFFKITHRDNSFNIGADDGEIDESLVSEQDLFDFVHDHQMQQRKAGNYFQPQLVPSITPTGFEKMRIPEGLFEEIRSFFKARESFQQSEYHVGACINQEIVPTFMINLSQELRQKIITQLQPILEKWAGFELESTSLYGDSSISLLF